MIFQNDFLKFPETLCQSKTSTLNGKLDSAKSYFNKAKV